MPYSNIEQVDAFSSIPCLRTKSGFVGVAQVGLHLFEDGIHSSIVRQHEEPPARRLTKVTQRLVARKSKTFAMGSHRVDGDIPALRSSNDFPLSVKASIVLPVAQ